MPISISFPHVRLAPYTTTYLMHRNTSEIDQRGPGSDLRQTSSRLANSAYQSTAPSSAYAVKPGANVSSRSLFISTLVMAKLRC